MHVWFSEKLYLPAPIAENTLNKHNNINSINDNVSNVQEIIHFLLLKKRRENL